MDAKAADEYINAAKNYGTAASLADAAAAGYRLAVVYLQKAHASAERVVVRLKRTGQGATSAGKAAEQKAKQIRDQAVQPWVDAILSDALKGALAKLRTKMERKAKHEKEESNERWF